MFYPVLCWPFEKPFVVTPTWHKKHQKKTNSQKQKQYSNNKPEYYLKPISFGKNIFSDKFHYNPILTVFFKGKGWNGCSNFYRFYFFTFLILFFKTHLHWWMKINSEKGFDLDSWPRDVIQCHCKPFDHRHPVCEVWARLDQGEIIYDPDKDFSDNSAMT